jgi:hypothetical protein
MEWAIKSGKAGFISGKDEKSMVSSFQFSKDVPGSLVTVHKIGQLHPWDCHLIVYILWVSTGIGRNEN